MKLRTASDIVTMFTSRRFVFVTAAACDYARTVAGVGRDELWKALKAAGVKVWKGKA